MDENQIISVLERVDGEGFTLDDAIEHLENFHPEVIYDHELSCYDEIWENSEVTKHNSQQSSAFACFFTLYRIKPEYRKEDRSEYYPVFKLVVGPLGNTTIVRLN